MESLTSLVNSSPHASETGGLSMRATLIYSAAALAVVLVVMPNSAHAAPSSIENLFSNDGPLTPADLEVERGGFRLPNGAKINFGIQIQQFVNNTMLNDVQIASHAANHFTVTQTAQSGQTTTTNLSQLPSSGIVAQTQANNGLTNLGVTVTNGSIQSLVQNAANNTSIRTAMTVNIDTQGLSNVLHSGMGGAQVIQTLQANTFIHH